MFYPTLLKAVEKEDVEDVMWHLNNGADVNSENSDCQTPLHLAVDKIESIEIVEILINFKAQLNSIDLNGWTPLDYAVDKCNMDIIKLLVDAGAELESAIYLSVQGNDASILKYFLCLPGVSTGMLSSALSTACNYGYIEMVNMLIDSGAQLFPEAGDWDSGLHIAAQKNYLDIVELFLSHGVYVDSKYRGYTALYKASVANEGDSHFEVVEKLLTNGADPNVQNDQGQTVLHNLILKANYKTVKLLLEFGTTVNVVENFDYETPLSLAVGAKKTDIVKLLIDHGADVNYFNPKFGTTPMHYAMEEGSDIEIIKGLLKFGARTDVPDLREGRTPLLWGLKYNKFDLTNKILRLVVKYSDVNIIDKYEQNVLSLIGTDGKMWKIILEHLAKLQALELPVHPSLFDSISSNAEFNRHFSKCTQELLLAKSAKLNNSWVSYFNLLVGSNRMLKNYAGNQDLVDDFHNSGLIKKFRIYGSCISKKMIKGIKRRMLYDKSTMLLYSSLPIFNPSHLIIRDILDNFTLNDLTKLN